MRVCSIDVGTRNCAFYIEEFNEKEIQALQKIKDPVEQKKYLYQIGKVLFWEVIDFEKEIGTEEYIFRPIISFLDKNVQLFGKCNGIIIEKQMKINYNAQIIQNFLLSYFKIEFGSFKYIADISATRKTQTLNAPKKLNKRERKQWAIQEALEVCKLRGDTEGYIRLKSKKADDLADSCLQLKAFQKMIFIHNLIP